MFIAKMAPSPAAPALPDVADADLTAYREPGFEFDVSELMEAQRELEAVRPDDDGVRWVYTPGSVSFYASHNIDAPYDSFVEAVDIAAVGAMFRAVRDSSTEVIQRDPRGRARLQIERMAVLAQPSHSTYMARHNLVYTLERMDYAPHEQRAWIRTVHGPATGKVCEDGFLAIRRRNDGGTRVALLTRQQFPTSSLLMLSGLDRWSWLKNRLSVNAFRCFFLRTMSTIEAGYAGPQLRLGA
ncbi:MAG: hypothetical protein WA880_05150 [Ornithinimicrobium sp.]